MPNCVCTWKLESPNQHKRTAANSESRTKTTSKVWKHEKAIRSCIKMHVIQKANKSSGDKKYKAQENTTAITPFNILRTLEGLPS